ncbi:hypothetical protein P7D22_17305 [Lichenihabitans sp. Uapishka_5]|uniref:hypothetical protein n=1 Tax=Lichenihabitans sp. Uapishka_5 TaxID=3037302 RepID=UPI0029E7EC2C|nr:hypothetical protein [Lichenihabitans sp. Uapishka_5]MDX7952925.1 hypothetical protein [Lichenihabitans sp. Uapishka_5]
MDLIAVQGMIEDIDLRIEAERGDLLRLVAESNARTVAMMFRRERLMAALQSVSAEMQQDIEAAPGRDVRRSPAPFDAAQVPTAHPPYMPGRAAKLILDALEQAGAQGLSGGEVNEAVRNGGLSLDAAEKTKSRLKKAGLAEHDNRIKRWWAKGQGPANTASITEVRL